MPGGLRQQKRLARGRCEDDGMELRTERLVFREMTDGDLDAMAGLLGDPRVIRNYPRPKTRDEAQQWIDWNRANYRDLGFGLWILETPDGQFVGDCGLTMQKSKGCVRSVGLPRLR